MRLNKWQTRLSFLLFTFFILWDASAALATRGLSTCQASAPGVRWLEKPPGALIRSLLAMPDTSFTESTQNVAAILSLEGQMAIATITGFALLCRRVIQVVYHPKDTRNDFVENYVIYFGISPTPIKFRIWAVGCFFVVVAMLYIWYIITTGVDVCKFDSSFSKMFVNSSAAVLYALFLGNLAPMFLIMLGFI